MRVLRRSVSPSWALALVAFLIGQTASTSDPAWTTKAPLLAAQGWQIGAAVGGTVYSIGGTDGFNWLSTVEAYDPNTNTWVMKAPMPTARAVMGGAVVGSIIYAIGGAGGSATVQAYDSDTDTWVTKAPMPTARRDLAAAAVGGTIYTFGGGNGGGPLSTVEAYDPNTDTWVTKAGMPTARVNPAAAAVGGKIYVIGGQNSFYRATVEAYDPNTNTWATKAPMPTARGMLAAAVVGGTIYAIGGYTSGVDYFTVEAYDPNTNTWVTKTRMPTKREFLAAAAVGGTIYAIGGQQSSPSITTVEAGMPGADLAAGLSMLASAVCTGQGFLLTLTVTNTGRVTALGLDAAPFLLGGGGGVTWADGPFPSLPLDLAGGASKTFTWSYTGSGPGLVAWTTTVVGTDVDSGLTVTTGAVVSNGITVGAPGGLLAPSTAVQPNVSVGQWCAVALTVTNTGVADVTGLTATIYVNPGGALTSRPSPPVPSSVPLLTVGASQTFVFGLTATGAGLVTFTTSGMGTCVTTAGSTSSVTIQTPAALAAVADMFAGVICLGQGFLVTVTVTNTGQAGAVNVNVPAMPFVMSGSGGAALAAGPTPAMPVTLTGGSSRTFTWTYTGSSAGSVWLTTTVTGTDMNSGQVVKTGPEPTSTGTIAAPGTLVASGSAPASVSVGQWFQVKLTVTNTGGVAVTGLAATLYAGPGGALASVPGGPVPVDLASLAPGTATTFVFSCTATGSGPVTLSMTVNGTALCGGVPTPVEAVAVATVTIQMPAVQVIDAQSPASPGVGVPVTYRIVVENAGTVVIDSLVVVDTISPVVTPPYSADQPAGFALTSPVSVTGGTRFEWSGTGLNMVPSATFTFTITGTVGSVGVSTWVTNSSHVTAGTVCGTTVMQSSAAGFGVTAPPAPMNIITVAGTGVQGYNGDGIAGTAAQLSAPVGGCFDGAGNLFFSDYANDRIRKIDLNGEITTVAGSGVKGYFGDGGPAVSAQMDSPGQVALDSFGNIYIPDHVNRRVRKVDLAGNITTFAGDGTWGYGGDGGPATSAQLGRPSQVLVDPTGNVYISDQYNHVVRRVDTGGIITTVVGNGVQGYSGDGGPATSAELYAPVSLAMDSFGNLYVGDIDLGCVRKVDTSGMITTYAGTGVSGFFGDGGPATSAQLYGPFSLVCDASGNLYIADRNNHRVRRVDAARNIATIAGAGTAGFSGDGGPAASAEMNQTTGVMLDLSGNLYVADWLNHRIRKVGQQLFMLSERVAPAGPVCAGSALTCTISWSNYGTATITGLTITDTLPADTLYSSPSRVYWGDNPIVSSAYATSMAGPWTAGEPPNATGPPLVMRWVVGDVYPGHSGFITYRANVSSAVPGWTTIANRASATIYGDRWTTLTPDAKVEAYGMNVAVANTQTPANPAVGGRVTYRIVVANIGAATITDLLIADSIAPVIMSATTDEPSGFPAPLVSSVAGTGSLFVWSASGLTFAPGQIFTFTITGGVGDVCGSTAVSNTAFVIAMTSCSATALASQAAGMVVAPLVVGLTIVKMQTPASPVVGGPVQYQILVTNTGSATVESIVVVDTLSPMITGVVVSSPAGFSAQPVAQSSSGTIYSWANAVPFAPGSAATFQLDGTLGTVCFQATVSNTAYLATVASCTATVLGSNVTGFTLALPVMSASVMKTQTGGGGVGAPVEYMIHVTNTGGVVIDGLTIVDTLSPVLSNAVTAQPPPFAAPVVTSAAGSGTRYVWSAAGVNLAPAQTLTITVTGEMGYVCATTAVSGAAYMTVRDAGACGEMRGFSNAVGNVVEPPGSAISVVNTQVGGGPSGSGVIYTIVVTNTGAATIDRLTVVDTVSPILVNGMTAQPAGFGPPTVAGTGSGTRYVWSSVGLAFLPGAQLSFTVTGNVGAVCASTSVSNTGYAVAGSACATSGSFAPVVGFTTTGGGCGAAALSVGIAFVPGNPRVGDAWQAWVTVSNTGTASANSVAATLLVVNGGGNLKEMNGPVPSGPVTLAPGAAQVFVWSGNSAAAGRISFSVSATGIDSVGGAPLFAAIAGSLSVAPGQSVAQRVLDQAAPGTEAAVFPNPVKGGDKARIALKLKFGCATEVVLDAFTADFRPYYHATFNNVSAGDGLLDLSGLRQWPPGVYLLKITAKCPAHPDQVFPITRLEVSR
ncbi:MAG: kelch repeat-containing protein [Candidatus Coatesbacteria bacterium]